MSRLARLNTRALQPTLFNKQRVTFINGSRALVTYIYKPMGPDRSAGPTAAMPISRAALSWSGYTILQHRLVDAVRRIDMRCR